MSVQRTQQQSTPIIQVTQLGQQQNTFFQSTLRRDNSQPTLQCIKSKKKRQLTSLSGKSPQISAGQKGSGVQLNSVNLNGTLSSTSTIQSNTSYGNTRDVFSKTLKSSKSISNLTTTQTGNLNSTQRPATNHAKKGIRGGDVQKQLGRMQPSQKSNNFDPKATLTGMSTMTATGNSYQTSSFQDQVPKQQINLASSGSSQKQTILKRPIQMASSVEYLPRQLSAHNNLNPLTKSDQGSQKSLSKTAHQYKQSTGSISNRAKNQNIILDQHQKQQHKSGNALILIDNVPAAKTHRSNNIKIKLSPRQMLSSFKDSFVDSDNFCNVDERIVLKGGNLQFNQQSAPQKSMKEMIKERFMGPVLASQDNTLSKSLLRRNYLPTISNNCSYRTSTCSIKSSFLVGKKINRASAIANPSAATVKTVESCCFNEELEEAAIQKNHCCDNIDQYNMMPRTIYNEIISDFDQHRLSTYPNVQKPTKLDQFVSKVNQNNGLLHVTRKNQDKSGFSQDRSSISEMSATPSELKCEDEFIQKEDFPPNQENNNSQFQQSEDIIEFLQSDTHKMHLIQTLQSLQYVKHHLDSPTQDEIFKKRVLLPPFKQPWITKTIVFDLDETLVHCIEDYMNKNVDQLIQVRFPSGEIASAGINIRPFAFDCLKRAAQLFQLVVFTASHQAYADVVLDIIDPNHEIFVKRLYRESCIKTSEGGVYVKDLRIFEPSRKLEDIVIVDNAVYSFGYQLENGIPIIPFYDDKQDEELLHLIQYLECLYRTGGDVRDHNRKAFQLKELQDLDVQNFLHSMLVENQLLPSNTQLPANYQVQGSSQQIMATNHLDLINDRSIINEEPGEDEESQTQTQESGYKEPKSFVPINRRRILVELQTDEKNPAQIIDSLEDEEEEDDGFDLDCEDTDERYGRRSADQSIPDNHQQRITNTSILMEEQPDEDV